MKKKQELKSAGTILVVCMLLAGIAYAFGFLKYTFQISGLTVTVYPAAFLVLVGIVKFWQAWVANGTRA